MNILHLEDDPLDAELVWECLREGGIAGKALRVETRADFLAALQRGPYDLILADYSLPGFDGVSALAMARQCHPEVPFVFVSGALGEERAIDTLKAGATDYVLKQRLERLVPSVQRALREAEERAQRQRLEEALRQRADELADRDRRKDEFLAMLGHELRNPLGAVSNAVQILQRLSPDEPRLRRAVETIARQVRHQTRLIDDLLDVARITRGKVSLEPEWLDLGWLLRHAVQDHQHAFETARLTLALDVPPEPVWAAGDRTRLTQVMENLLTNALKFTDPGGRVTVCLTVDSARAIVAVRDTGMGIDPIMLPRIFDSFTQADRSLDRSKGGLGLGLTLVRGLIELHRGEVWADSPGLGGGAEFRFSLPLDPVRGAGSAAEPPAAPAKLRLRILVVEDNRDAAETLRDLLELSGHEAQIALSGPEAVLLAHRMRPQVVLCDIGLPGMDGYAVAERLRSRPETADACLIALTGYAGEEDRGRSLAAGFARHLIKPVDFIQLEQALQAALPAG